MYACKHAGAALDSVVDPREGGLATRAHRAVRPPRRRCWVWVVSKPTDQTAEDLADALFPTGMSRVFEVHAYVHKAPFQHRPTNGNLHAAGIHDNQQIVPN